MPLPSQLSTGAAPVQGVQQRPCRSMTQTRRHGAPTMYGRQAAAALGLPDGRCSGCTWTAALHSSNDVGYGNSSNFHLQLFLISAFLLQRTDEKNGHKDFV
ncbi:hypothetical protein TRIUR3_25134 [Triticum urartu]|uniref:Uncharacterized protein n=1 Tax=Triticum urartu TaxID=4572 RepID=M7ZGE3_TRIUA|nr:hypothetical protein TRIUR3_25134 [Triticum urartu]